MICAQQIAEPVRENYAGSRKVLCWFQRNVAGRLAQGVLQHE